MDGDPSQEDRIRLIGRLALHHEGPHLKREDLLLFIYLFGR